MKDQPSKRDETIPIDVPPPVIRSIVDITTGQEIQRFEQTPSEVMARTGSELEPHALFQFFTAGIILQDEVFIR